MNPRLNPDAQYSITLKGTGTVLAGRARPALSFGARLKGLLGTGSLSDGEALVISPCNAVHMFFMRYPIDAVMVDPDWRVVGVYYTLRPWRMTRIHSDAESTIELPAGVCMRAGLRVGDLLEISVNGRSD
ncbi:MAG: DUF192 domain-containing protein [Myxococcota bacterium]